MAAAALWATDSTVANEADGRDRTEEGGSRAAPRRDLEAALGLSRTALRRAERAVDRTSLRTRLDAAELAQESQHTRI